MDRQLLAVFLIITLVLILATGAPVWSLVFVAIGVVALCVWG